MGHGVVILVDKIDRQILTSRMKIVYTNGAGQGTDQGLAIAHDTITNKYGGWITLYREEEKERSWLSGFLRAARHFTEYRVSGAKRQPNRYLTFILCYC